MSSLTDQEKQNLKEKILDMAFYEANKWGVGAFLVTGAATLLAAKRSKKFDQMLSISAKMSLPIMSSIGLWSFKYETIVHEAQTRPEKWGLTPHTVAEGAVVVVVKKQKSLPFHQSVMNYIYDHPFHFIAALGLPLAATIMNQQMHNAHLTFSQKIMHSRVFAQGGVISILLTTMAFREYMDRHGRFEPEEEEEVVRKL